MLYKYGNSVAFLGLDFSVASVKEYMAWQWKWNKEVADMRD